MKNFQNIVLATDFSDSSTNAYNYARQLTAHFDATLTVVHVYDMPISPDTLDYLAILPSPTDLEKAVQERMTHFIATHDGAVASLPKLKTKALLGMGFPSDTLIEHSKNPMADLLILGTEGGANWLDKVFGTVAVEVLTKAHCPVLLVPKAANYKGIYNALYAASPNASSDKDVRLAIDFAHYFDAALHFVHVKGVFEDPEHDAHLLFERILAQKGIYSPYFVENVAAETIAEGIHTYTSEHPIDLIIAVTKHRGFWADLVHYSTTREVAWHTDLPILCLHTDDESDVMMQQGYLKAEKAEYTEGVLEG
jgi:nucleotide-binding universal stress UspA family protein